MDGRRLEAGQDRPEYEAFGRSAHSSSGEGTSKGREGDEVEVGGIVIVMPRRLG